MRNCYAHVEEQEAFYRRLDGIEELPVEEIDPVDETPEESVQTAVEGALVFEDGQFLVPEDAVIEESETRRRLIEGLRLLAGKRDSNPPKKHGNEPL